MIFFLKGNYTVTDILISFLCSPSLFLSLFLFLLQFETRQVRTLHIEHFPGLPGLRADTCGCYSRKMHYLCFLWTTTLKKNLHLLNILTKMIYAGSHQRTCFVLNLFHILHIAGLFILRYVAYQARKEVQQCKNQNCL